MRFILITLLTTFLTTSFANAGNITKDMTDRYYLNCKNQKANKNLSDESHDMLCGCTAQRILDTMNVEDMRAMSLPDEAGRLAMNKMIIQVYAPCMKYPAKDHYFSTCINNPETANITKNPTALCGCLADQVSGYLEKNGEQVFSEILGKNPFIADPMQALEQDPNFQKYVGQQLMTCVQ